jgi:peptidoglycan/LPS O-acetylase OafA/YrhL
MIDVFKTVASQVIVWHHLSCYGPMSDVVRAAYGAGVDAAFEGLFQYGRAAVYAFLVVGGYLAAAALLPRPGRPGAPIGVTEAAGRIARRYWRLAAPLWVALLAALSAAAIARALIVHPATPAAPSVGEFVAHLLLLQDVLGIEALSAGVWYVAIDLQLYAMLLLIAMLARSRTSAAAPAIALFLVLVAAGLAWFGRESRLDVWAIYFFGAYGLGVLACWCTHDPAVSAGRPAPAARSRWFGVLLAACAVALAADFRARTVVGVATALVLATGFSMRGAGAPVFAAGARISYSLFLIHYPVCLGVNAVFASLWGQDPAMNLVGLVVAWSLSNLAGWVLHRTIEARAIRATRQVRALTAGAVAPS